MGFIFRKNAVRRFFFGIGCLLGSGESGWISRVGGSGDFYIFLV